MSLKTSPRVLISVRNEVEAEEALAGGATLLDVKEPSRGPLGAAEDAVLRAIAATVRGRALLSAACGELLEVSQLPDLDGYWAAKVGLAGCASVAGWPERLESLIAALSRDHAMPARPLAGFNPIFAAEQSQARRNRIGGGVILVPVAYADAERADAPPVPMVLETAWACHWPAVMIDTCCKDGPCLFDYLAPEFLADWAMRLRRGGIVFALAGSLQVEHAALLKAIGPAIVAFRSAACPDQRRQSRLCRQRVGQLVREFIGDGVAGYSDTTAEASLARSVSALELAPTATSTPPPGPGEQASANDKSRCSPQERAR